MKVLIGTPIHACKDYAIERWLQNVSKLTYPADLFMVDNSSGPDYAEKVKGYCAKRGMTNYRIERLEIDQTLGLSIRIEAAQETIRRYVLSRGYDAWFSWECDQIIPNNALDELVRLIKTRDFMMVVHDSHARWDEEIPNMNMGVTLIKKECLEKNWFLPSKNGGISLDPADSYDINDPTVYKNRVLKSGGRYLGVFGAIRPIHHLDK